MKNIFTAEVTKEIIQRIEQLNSNSTPQWGKMNVAQMLAHCSVTYDMSIDEKYPKAKGFKKFILKTFVKNIVVSEKPYKKNSSTAPEFIITNPVEFEKEKNTLIQHITKATQNGEAFYDGKESVSFGKLNSKEWNNMFYKHLDHHLSQFGV